MKTIRPRPTAGFTLAEVMVTVGIVTLVGLMIFLVLNTSMVLYAKNTAVNSAHQQARTGVDQMLINLHDAVSIPQLVDTNLNPAPELDAKGKPLPAAGISFQVFENGPFPVASDANAASTSLVLYCPGYTPPAQARLNIPSHNIELDVISTSAGYGYRQFNFASPIGTAVQVDGGGTEETGAKYMITAFMTTRLSYAVVGSDLRYYPTNNKSVYRVISRNLVSPKPFSIPLQADGGLQNRYVAAVNLSTVEPNFTQRGYAAVNMFISSMIPFRCRLTNQQ